MEVKQVILSTNQNLSASLVGGSETSDLIYQSELDLPLW